jgi:uncharacterized protein (DUF4213/DUF364 family)
MGVIVAQVEELILENELQFEVANLTIMREWKWLFVNDCECWSLISVMTEF